MLNKIIKSSLDNRLAVVVLTGLLLVAGVIVMMRMEVDIFPDLNAPTVAVMTEAPGMAPEEIETTVTYPVETAVNGASGVRRVRSATTTGFSVVWVEFDWNTDPYLARQIVAEKLSEIEGTLPPGTGSPTWQPILNTWGDDDYRHDIGRLYDQSPGITHACRTTGASAYPFAGRSVAGVGDRWGCQGVSDTPLSSQDAALWSDSESGEGVSVRHEP